MQGDSGNRVRSKDADRGNGGLEAKDAGTAPTDASSSRETRREGVRDPRPGVVVIFPRADDAVTEICLVSGATSVGRSRQAALRLNDTRISRIHAALEPRNGGLWVRDLKSRHGSFIDGQGVAPDGALAPYGSVLRVGDSLLLVVDDVEPHHSRPRRMNGARLGLGRELIAGPSLSQAWDDASRAALLEDPVLIQGESGSGKEGIARIVHAARPDPGPFVGLNVAAIPDGLFEAELFGFERGAFTGAITARDGAFREAAGGVLFLDEVGDLRLDLQSKLLRAVDLRAVRALGARKDSEVNARVVSATHRDLKQACSAGQFRADLYYRLSGIVIRVPPLRERRDDILLFATSVLREQASAIQLSADAAEALVTAPWEGNVRQLRQAVMHATQNALTSGHKRIQKKHLPDLRQADAVDPELTLERIQSAMAKAGGVASRAAQALGISRTTLYNALRRLNVDSASLRRK